MRLHRLSLQAIGPFADHHAIDFDALGAAGLFLLEGPTGSGKSTIIDAVVFALYGDVAGSQASEDRLASDLAAPGSEPRVELVFSTPSGVYRVNRSPRYERDKRRGSGRTTINARATLERLLGIDDSAGEALGTGVGDVNVQIQQLVGLSLQQFVQTVVLPQGEFAMFLQSDADKRRDLLQRLFGTQVYARVQSVLEQRRRDAKDRLHVADQDVDQSFAVFLAAAASITGSGNETDELSLLVESTSDPDGDAVVEGAVANRLVAMQQRVDASTERYQRFQREAEQARDRFTAQSQLREQIELKRTVLTEQESMTKLLDLDRNERDALRAAQRHETVRGLMDSVDAAVQKQTHATEALQNALRQDPLGLLGGADNEPSWRDRRNVIVAERAKVAEVVELERSLPSRIKEAARLTAEADRAASALAAAQTDESKVPAQLAAMSAERIELTTRLADEPQRLSHREACRVRLAAATKATSLRSTLDREEQRLRHAARLTSTAIKDESELRGRRVDGMAGELAQSLTPGAACPVCGSSEHPEPAVAGLSQVTAEQVQQAESRRQDLEAQLLSVRGQVAGLTADLARAQGQAGRGSVDELQAEFLVAEGAVQDLSRARERLDELSATTAKAEQRSREVAEEVARCASSARTTDVAAATARADLAGDQQRVDRAQGEFESVRARDEALRAELTALDQALAAVVAVHACRADVSVRTDELQVGLTRAGFRDRAAAVDAALDPDELRQLQDSIDERERTSSRISERLADLIGVDESVGIDLEGERRKLDQAIDEEAAALAVVSGARQSLEQARRAGEHLRQSLRVRKAQSVALRPLIRIADVVAAATADNSRSMTLATFVLIERFRDVVAAANQRLSAMSDGRYSLAHVVDKEGQRRSGLGLTVYDVHSERPRDPRTLSGGETFYCSLALALGLADVVTAESGGITLETLFIDEGFGSLDPGTLDQVLDVLVGLSRSGRTVGVVSHVSELKERIPERIQVRRLARGISTLEVMA